MDISKKLEFSSSIYQQIISRLGTIDNFKGEWKTLAVNESQQLSELKKIATIESIGSSTRIEGATLTDSEVEKILKSVKIKKFKTRDEEEIVGYYDALKIILEHYNSIKILENEIHNLHHILLKYSSKDQHHKGNYKIHPNKVVANYPKGIQRTIFNTTEPHLTNVAMESLFIWHNENIKKNHLHPLLLIATFIYEFLSIHPYQDGNGRLSRLLTTLLLMQNGYSFVQFVSFENIIETKKDEYYRALMDGQKNRNTSKEKIEKWVLFFLDCIVILIERLEAKYKVYSQLKKGINKRQEAILKQIKKRQPAQISDIANALEEYPRNTIKKDLVYLLNEGFIIKTGDRKATKYHLNPQ
jgi:Fic family protein